VTPSTDRERLALIGAGFAVSSIETVLLYSPISDLARLRGLRDCATIRHALNACRPFMQMATAIVPVVD
jgi:hypothetical protein